MRKGVHLVQLRYSRNMRIILEALADAGGRVWAVSLAEICLGTMTDDVPVSTAMRAQVRRSVKRAVRGLADRGDVTLSYGEDPGFVSASRNWRQKILQVQLTNAGYARVEGWRAAALSTASETDQLDRLVGGGWD